LPASGQNLTGIAFDLYERYSLLERAGAFFARSGSALRVLDVGGHTPVLWPGFRSLASEILPGAFAVTIDVQAGCGLANYVQGSASRLPFSDGRFDLVCAFDTLEHIPQEQRAPALREMLRVSRDGLFLCFPFDSEENRRAEEMLTGFLSQYEAGPLPQLEEHRKFGLPKREEILENLRSLGSPVVSFGHGNTDVWLLMMLAYHSLRSAGDALVADLNRRFNATRAARDWAEPCYRAGFLLSKTRPRAELEGLADSLRDGGNEPLRAEAVLPLCQILLQIAHQGAVVLDKDRHIRNLESALAAAAADRQRLEALTAELAEQKQIALVLKRNDVATKSVLSAQYEELAAGLEAVRNATAHAATSGERLSAEVEKLDRKISLLGGRVQQDALRLRQILESRTWRALTGLGGIALKLRSLGYREDVFLLTADEPVTDEFTPRSGTITVRGWALARDGIARIGVQVDEAPPIEAQHGLPRPDVGKTFPGVKEAARSGFRLELDSLPIPGGIHAIRITATSVSGAVRSECRHVLIDHQRAFASDYQRWIAEFETPREQALLARLPEFASGPVFSVILPVYRTPPELLECAIGSVRSQSYPRWELCVADDCSESAEIAAILEKHAAQDRRVKVAVLDKNRGISGASNAALGLATGDYVAALDHDDELAPNALLHAAAAIAGAPEADLLYSDEDKIDAHGRRSDPFFKPDWSPDLLLSENYVCHLLVARRALVERVGAFRGEYDGSQDYDLVLRLARETARIVHIPHVLYRWRTAASSTALDSGHKPYANDAARRAIADNLMARGVAASVEQGCAPGRFRVRYAIPGEPEVTILIPSGGRVDVLRKNLKSLAAKTEYRHYRVVVIDNSRGTEVERCIRKLKGKILLEYLDFRNRPFNYSALNNTAARQSKTPLLLFLNDDTEAIAPGWLGAMVELAMRPEVGAVGAKLLYPDGRIQHAGVVMGLFENCGHAFKGLDGRLQHYFDLPDAIRNVSAVTGACLMTRSEIFAEVGGFDEARLAVAFNDIDLCLKIGSRGYRVLYTPHALLYHHEALSKTGRDLIPHTDEVAVMQSRWKDTIAADPFYSPNLSRTEEDYSLRRKE
jgi:GT2 family glycosyltransferase